jgi:predicted ATPase
VAVKDGLLENMIGSPSYKFAHDRIQQAAHMLVQGDEQYTLKMTVGKYILNQRPTEDSEGLFLAVDLFNSVPLLLLRQHLEIDRIIELNVEVAEAACRISAFAAATNNLYRGIELMESVDNRWNEHYNLCLRLYNSACEVEFCVGDFQRAQGYCDEVLAYAKSFDEKLRAYQAKSDGLGQRERHADALEIDKEVLTNLGQAPRYTNMLNVIIQLSSMKSTMAKTSDDEIRGLPLLQDEKLIIAIETLSKMATRAFYCDQKFLSLLCVIRQLQLTLKYGLTQASSYAIAGYGTMCHMALGEEKLGLRMASLAFDVAKITKAKAYEAKILFTLTK